MQGKKTVLITGGAGFIGANLARKLVSLGGFDVFVIEKNGVNLWRLKDILDNVIIKYVDLEDITSLQSALRQIKPDFVFHLATYGVYGASQNDIRKMVDVNIKATLNLIDTVKDSNLTAFINTSSCGEYKAKKSSLNENDPVDPSNLHGITKLASELLLKKIAEKEGLPIINVRLFTAYGSYEDSQRLIPYIILNALQGKKIELTSPSHVRDFTFIEDIIDAFLKIIESKKKYKGEIFNIGSGKQQSIKSVVETIEKILGRKINVSYGKRISYYDEPTFYQANNTKFKKAFNWKVNHSFQSGILKNIEWFKNNQQLYDGK